MYFEPVVPFVEVDFIELFLQKPFTQYTLSIVCVQYRKKSTDKGLT